MIEVSPEHAFWTHQPLLLVSQNVDLSFYFLRTGIKRCHSVPSLDYTAHDSSNRYFECSKKQLFEPTCDRSHCRGKKWSVFGSWLSSCLERQLANKCLCITQIRLFWVVLVVRLRHVQFLLIICQIRREHNYYHSRTSWKKKNVKWRTQYNAYMLLVAVIVLLRKGKRCNIV